MVVIHSGPSGIGGVVGHVVEELGTSIVSAIILDQQMEEKAVGDWDQMLNHKVATPISVQVKLEFMYRMCQKFHELR